MKINDISTPDNALQRRLKELSVINPNNLQCSSCASYPGWRSGRCKSINPLFFCEKHTGLATGKTMKPEEIEKIHALMAEHDITNVEYFVAWVRLNAFAILRTALKTTLKY